MRNYIKLRSLLEEFHFKKENLELVDVWRYKISSDRMLRIDIEQEDDELIVTFLNRNDFLYRMRIKEIDIEIEHYLIHHFMNFKEILKNTLEIPSLTLINLSGELLDDVAFTMIYYANKGCVCQKVSKSDKSYKKEVLDFLKIKGVDKINLTIVAKSDNHVKFNTSYDTLKNKLTNKFELNQLEQIITRDEKQKRS